MSETELGSQKEISENLFSTSSTTTTTTSDISLPVVQEEETGTETKTETVETTSAGTKIAEPEAVELQTKIIESHLSNGIEHKEECKEAESNTENGLVCDNEEISPTSDRDAESDNESDDLNNSDEGTCSRSRPYVRRLKSPPINGSCELVPRPLKKTVAMPTPPDEREVDDDSKIKISLNDYTPCLIPSAKRGSLDNFDPLESSKTELYVIKEGNIDTKVSQSPADHGDRCGGGESRDVKCDSSSVEGETSSKRPVTTKEAKSTPHSHSLFPSKVPLIAPDHKDKRPAATTPTGKDTHTHHHTHSSGYHPQHHTKKGSKIPVGIAVAWQRFVTSNSALQNTSTTMTSSCAPSSKSDTAANTAMSKISCKDKDRDKKQNEVKVPVRPSSASPINYMNNMKKAKEQESKSGKEVKRSACFVGASGGDVGVGVKRLVENKALTSELSAIASSSRPLPSSSVPPNLGLSSYFPHPHSSLLDYRYEASMRSMSPFVHQHNGHYTLPPTWQNSLGVGMGSDLTVPQGLTSPGAYLQQTMQQQFQQQLMQQYSNYSSNPTLHPHYLLGGGYETLRHQYEQHMQQQHQSAEFYRHLQQHHQSQLSQQLLVSSGLYHHPPHEGLRTIPTTFPPTNRLGIPLLSPSPTGSVRTPTPNSVLNPSHQSLSLSNLSGFTTQTTAASVSQSSNWPTDLFHHNSSAALSPKSLTSSSPSPVTVQSYNHPKQGAFVNTIAGGGGSTTFTGIREKKCATPNHSPGYGTGLPLKDVWEHASPKSQAKKQHLSLSADKDLNDKQDVGAKESPEKKELDRHSRSERTPSHQKPTTTSSSNETVEHVSAPSGDGCNNTKFEAFSPPPPPLMSPSSVSSSKNDFTKMDSLIEKREACQEILTDCDTKMEENNSSGSIIVEEKVKMVPIVKDETTKDLKELQLQHPPLLLPVSNSPPTVSTFQPAPVASNKKTATITTTTTKSKTKKEGVEDDKKKRKQSLPLKFNKEKIIRPVKLDFNENQCNDRKPKKVIKNKSKNKGENEPAAGETCVKVRTKKVNKTKAGIVATIESPSETLQLKKQSKPKVYKSKKAKEQEINRLSSCDPVSKDYKGNNVPELNLPVASSDIVTSFSTIKDNVNSTDIKGHPLFGAMSPTHAPLVTLLVNGKMKKERKKAPKKDAIAGACKPKLSPKRKPKDEIFQEKIKRVKVKKIKVAKKCSKKPPVAIKSKDQMSITTGAPTTDTTTTTVILATPTNQQAISFADGNTISLNQVNFPSSCGESGGGTNVSNPVIPPMSIPPYHNSPLTLILPRLLPQTTQITNSHHQTSFKLVVSSQEIKIPAFAPTQGVATTIEGTQQLQTFQLEQHANVHNFQNSFSSSLQNVKVNAVASSRTSTTITSSSSVITSSSCDSELASDRNNTITFIRDTPLSPPHHETAVRHILSHAPQNSLLSPTIPHNYFHSPPQSQIVRKDFLQPEDNHLNLLAAVAQEFGSRDDLGKLASHSSSSRGSSLMTSPILSMQSPAEVNYPTPSSTTSSNATATSISLPSSPLTAKFTSKSPYDEYEYDDKEQGTNEVSPLGSYKHPVWLKIPHVVPQAANKAAEKLRKLEKRKQDKETKFEWSKVSNKKKTQEVNTDKKPKRPKKSVKADEAVESKLKIPKISLTNSSGEEKQLSPQKKTKLSPGMKTETVNSSSHDTASVELENNPFRMKMKLPIPKVAKIRIKLSETKNPTLMEDKKTKLTVKNGESKIKRRHSDGDKEKAVKNKNNKANYMDLSCDKNTPKKTKPPQAKNYHEQHDNNNTPTRSAKEKKKAINSKNKHIAVVDALNSQSMKTTSLSKDLFPATFSPLTPPPTAKLPQLESQSTESSIFSPSNFQDPKGKSVFPTKVLNRVTDPSFAASAIRQNYLASSVTSVNANSIKTEILASSYDATSEEDEEEILMDFERRSAERMRADRTLSSKSSSSGVNEEESKKGLKSQLNKAFVPYTHKREKSRNHHVKPCLKPEPIVRPSSSEHKSEAENSDAEMDFEVASLTNSIPPRTGLSLLQQYRNKRKSLDAGGGSSSGSKSITTVIKHVTQNDHHQQQQLTQLNKMRRRLSSSTRSSPNKHSGRRLSLNMETGRTHEESEEELPDIDYPTTTTTYYTHHNYHSKSRDNENKQRRNSNNKHRSVSGGSASTSASSASCLPKRLPKKRSSRSLTTSSRSSATGSVVSLSKQGSSSYSSRRSRSMKEPCPADVHMEETLVPGKVELDSVDELLNEMRILTEIQGLFYTGKLNALQPPDVYGCVLDNERGAPPHIIFSAEEVLEKCVREKKPQNLTVGLRICAYWSPQYSGLYPGRVSTDFNPSFDPDKDLIPIEFDDGDTGMIKLGEIRMLPANHPIREYDPNPLLTLEKKHRKRRNSSTNPNSGPCTGEHEETDCGESYCAKVAKLDEEEGEEEDEEDDVKHHPYKPMYWTWTGLGYKRSKSKKTRNKEFFRGIQRGDEVIQVGDSAIFISHGNERPYIGRIEKFWETKGQKVVNVRWFYHPEEVKSPKRIPHLKHAGALFESPHIDENDVQTIAKKCEVLSYSEFKERIGRLPKLSLKNATSAATKPKDVYYVAGYYDPFKTNYKMIV